MQPKGDVSTLDRLSRLNGVNGKTNGVHTDGMVHSLLDEEHSENWKPEIPFENVRQCSYLHQIIKVVFEEHDELMSKTSYVLKGDQCTKGKPAMTSRPML